MDPCLELPLNDEVLDDVVEKAKDFCLMHGTSFIKKSENHKCV